MSTMETSGWMICVSAGWPVGIGVNQIKKGRVTLNFEYKDRERGFKECSRDSHWHLKKRNHEECEETLVSK